MHCLKRLILALLVIVACWCCCTTTVYASEIDDYKLISEKQENESEEVEAKLAEEAPKIIRISDIISGRISEADWHDVFAYYKHISGQDLVPLYDQTDYPHLPYGDYGTISSHGCGITCLSMVATYLTDDYETYQVDKLAEQFGEYNTVHGSLWKLFKDSAEELGLQLVPSDAHNAEWYSWKTVEEALRNGQVVIALQGEGLFTSGGHFIVLTGINEDGLITVNDPNGKNWYRNKELRDGFKYGFTKEQITENGGPYWIYDKKEVPNIELIGNVDILSMVIGAIDNGLSSFAATEDVVEQPMMVRQTVSAQPSVAVEEPLSITQD